LTFYAHLQDPPDAAAIAALRAQLATGIELTVGPGLPRPARYSVLADGRPTHERLLASPDLTTLIIPWAGLPNATRTLMLDYPGIAVHNLHYNARATAEMAVTLLLAAAKFVVPIDRALRRGDWSVRYAGDRSIEVAGKRALILGYGAIGRRVAAACRGLGMEVAVIRRNPSHESSASEGIECFPEAALHARLPLADALIICLPLTPATGGLIGARELELLPPEAILVNVGRGAVVDEEALFSALSSGRLFAAGLDVWYRYPENEAARTATWPSRFPFWELDHVVLSPHRAGDNAETESGRMAALARLINLAARGQALPDRVDVRAGY
jgi:phosphoglycerate dehydrogenase-like enzyme